MAERFRIWCADGTWDRLTEAAGLTGACDGPGAQQDDGLDDWTTPWHPAAAEDR